MTDQNHDGVNPFQGCSHGRCGESVTADQDGRINLGKTRAGRSFRVLEQGSHLILEPVETVHVPAAEAWLFRNTEALASVRRGLEEVAAGNLVEGPDLRAAHALVTSFPSEDSSEDDPLTLVFRTSGLGSGG